MINDNSFLLSLTGSATRASEPDTNNDNLISRLVQPSRSKQKDGDVRNHHSLSTLTVDHAKNTNLTGTIISTLVFHPIFIIQKKLY